MKRALLIVLDSVGCGNAPDAAEYGDEGADTLGHLFEKVPDLELPALTSLGLYRLLGRKTEVSPREGSKAFRLTETSAGKDTTTGHWEFMGCRIEEPFFTCESFPAEFMAELESATGTKFLGNKVASGTEILVELGESHCETGHPILYTSADSVLQIAAHEDVFGLEKLLEICRQARELLDRKGMKVGRVIARPFLGDGADSFSRTENRHDYSLTPEKTVLNRLREDGVTVTGVGKISDIFAGEGISESYPTKSNRDGMERIETLWLEDHRTDRLVFANLVDFDSLYGHRRNPRGYADCLMEFDRWLAGFLGKIGDDDLLIITADHGNDPYHAGTDHTREQVPCLVLANRFDCGEMTVFSDVGGCVGRYFA